MLIPAFRSQKSDRGAALAAVALAQLVGSDDRGPLAGDTLFLSSVRWISIVEAGVTLG